MNNDDKLIEKVIWTISDEVFDAAKITKKEQESLAKEIISLVRDRLMANHVLVPEGLYKQMKFESAQFLIEHPHIYLNSHNEG